MSKLIADKVLEELLLELKEGLKEGTGKLGSFGQRIRDNYYEAMINQYSTYVKVGGKLSDLVTDEAKLREELGRGVSALTKALQNNPLIKDQLYKRSYEELKALGDQESTYWTDLLQKIYEDEAYLNEIFVRLVEEQYKVEITSAIQLQELTGITALYNYWDKEKGFLEEDKAKSLAKKQKKPLENYKATPAQSQAEATRQLQEIFTTAMYYRYSTTLEGMIEEGAKYKDLLQLKPEQFNLPEDWGKQPGCLGTNQAVTLLWAIAFTLILDEGIRDEGVGRLIYNPSLRDIAQEIEAPYSVVMEAFKLVG